MKKLVYREGLLTREPIGITNGSLTLLESKGRGDKKGQGSKGLRKIRKVLAENHYSRKISRNSKLSLTVNEDKGFIQLGYGMNPTKKHTVSPLITLENHYEFDRMWLSDDLPKYSESQVIGLLLSYIKQVHKEIQFIITYADEAMGNTGVIYQATNAIYLGKHKTQFYILPNGERTHAVSLWHKYGTSTKEFLKKEGITAQETYQHRYLYILHKGMRKKYQGGIH